MNTNRLIINTLATVVIIMVMVGWNLWYRKWSWLISRYSSDISLETQIAQTGVRTVGDQTGPGLQSVGILA